MKKYIKKLFKITFGGLLKKDVKEDIDDEKIKKIILNTNEDQMAFEKMNELKDEFKSKSKKQNYELTQQLKELFGDENQPIQKSYENNSNCDFNKKIKKNHIIVGEEALQKKKMKGISFTIDDSNCQEELIDVSGTNLEADICDNILNEESDSITAIQASINKNMEERKKILTPKEIEDRKMSNE